MKSKQDGRLALAYFSPNYKYFDQLLQTVKNKTTVLILVFNDFLQTSLRPLISVLYAKGYHEFPLENFDLTVPKKFKEEPFCVSENFSYRKMVGIREEGVSRNIENFLLNSEKKLSQRSPSVFQNVSVIEIFYRLEGDITICCRKFSVSLYRETLKGNPSVFQKSSGIQNFHA